MKRGGRAVSCVAFAIIYETKQDFEINCKNDGIVLYYVQQNKEGDLYEYSKTVDY